MANDDTLNWLIGLIKSEGMLDPPSADHMEPVVRTGQTFPFRDPLKRGVPPDHQQALQAGITDGWLIGTFVVEWGYDVADDKASRFRRWLLDNEKEIYNCQPDGVLYKGTYAVFSSSEKGMGEYRTVWVFASLQGMQNFGAELSNDTSTFARLIKELNSFRDRDRGAGRSQQIYLAAAGAHRVA